MRICSVKLPDEMYDWALAAARAQDRSVSSLVRQALIAELARIPGGEVMPAPGTAADCRNEAPEKSETARDPAAPSRRASRAGSFHSTEAAMPDTPNHAAQHLDRIAAQEAAKTAEHRTAQQRVAQQNEDYLRNLNRPTEAEI